MSCLRLTGFWQLDCSARAVIGSVAAVRFDCARLQYDTGDTGMITFLGKDADRDTPPGS